MHTFNSPLFSTDPPATMPLHSPSSRMYFLAYSQTSSGLTLPQAARPRPREPPFQTLALTPGPAPHCHGRPSPVAQLVRCPLGQDRGGVVTAPLVDAALKSFSAVPAGTEEASTAHP